MTHAQQLRAALQGERILVAPGVYDALSAAFASEAGFPALYMSGAALAYTQFGLPDIGLISMAEVAEQLRRMRSRVTTPIIVDADTGFGNALSAQRAVRMFEAAGASALQLEDQTFPKRCGHLKGKAIISAEEMAGKIKAACDARANPDTVIIARTDAVAVTSMDDAIARAKLYAAAGADVLFVEAPRDAAQLKVIADNLRGVKPLFANMVEGGDTPPMSAQQLQALGFSIVIFPGALVRAFAHMADGFFASLAQHGSTEPFRDRMVDFGALNERLGTQQWLETGQRYERFEG
jgi:2-methylisocitrate lyase-like PEP mutase family enzyme